MYLEKEDIIRFEIFEMWIWQRIERVSWMESRTNEKILQRVEKTRGRLRTMLLNWLMKEDYSKLKARIGHGGE